MKKCSEPISIIKSHWGEYAVYVRYPQGWQQISNWYFRKGSAVRFIKQKLHREWKEV